MPKAIGFHVLVKTDEREEKSAGGILLPELSRARANEASETGVVVDIGPAAFKGRRDNPDGTPWYKVGDRVYFGRYGGRQVNIAGGRYRFFNDEEGIYGLVEETDGPQQEVL